MKKLLFLMVAGFTVFSLKDRVALTPDNQVHVASWSFPVPAMIQSSPVYMMVTTVMQGSPGPASQASAGPGAAANPQYRTAQPVRPALPNVTSTNGTYNANPAPAGAANGADQFSAVAKALRTQ
jgi:hypothetical protein